MTDTRQQHHRHTWVASLVTIITENNKRAARGDKEVSSRTKQLRFETIVAGFRELRALGFKIENPKNFSERHMRELVTQWEKGGLSPATIQNRISCFRVFASWIGKRTMIGDSAQYASSPNVVKRQYVATEDKSWSSHNVDAQAVLDTLSIEDQRTSVLLEVIKAFGLRRKEAVMLKPWRADKGDYLLVIDGTKGGRGRMVPIDSDIKRAALAHAQKTVSGVNEALGYPGLTLKQSLARLSNRMTKLGITKKGLGITLHGLRHEYANDRFEEMTGAKTPVRGGKKGELSKEIEDKARIDVSEELGHSRISVTATYYGSHGRAARQDNSTVE